MGRLDAKDIPNTLHHLLDVDWPAQGEWTYADYARLPDDGRKYEVMKGVLYMTPAPSSLHQRVAGNLYYALRKFVETGGGGEVLFSPIDVMLPAGLGTPVQPDLLYIAPQRSQIVGPGGIEGAPDLVVEILSPSNRAVDRRDKRQIYAEAGVPEYWIVDTEVRTVEVFVLEETEHYRLLERYGDGDRVQSRILPTLSVAVDEVIPR